MASVKTTLAFPQEMWSLLKCFDQRTKEKLLLCLHFLRSFSRTPVIYISATESYLLLLRAQILTVSSSFCFMGELLIFITKSFFSLPFSYAWWFHQVLFSVYFGLCLLFLEVFIRIWWCLAFCFISKWAWATQPFGGSLLGGTCSLASAYLSYFEKISNVIILRSFSLRQVKLPR